MFQTTNQYNKIILIDSYDIPCYSHRNPMKIGLLFAQRPLHGGSMKGARPARSHLDDVSDTTKISDWGSYSTEWGIFFKKSRIFQGCNEDIYGICMYIYIHIWIYTYIYNKQYIRLCLKVSYEHFFQNMMQAIGSWRTLCSGWW